MIRKASWLQMQGNALHFNSASTLRNGDYTQYRKMKDGTEVMLAIENGVNYFDTAYIYGGSEEALGTILERITSIFT